MILDPLNIHSHTRLMLIEQIMALHGRGSKNPKRYRELLEGFEIATLRRALTESDFPESSGIEMEAPMQPAGESPAQFPVPSLTENAGVIASTDTGTVPGSARESLILQPTLP